MIIYVRFTSKKLFSTHMLAFAVRVGTAFFRGWIFMVETKSFHLFFQMGGEKYQSPQQYQF